MRVCPGAWGWTSAGPSPVRAEGRAQDCYWCRGLRYGLKVCEQLPQHITSALPLQPLKLGTSKGSERQTRALETRSPTAVWSEIVLKTDLKKIL